MASLQDILLGLLTNTEEGEEEFDPPQDEESSTEDSENQQPGAGVADSLATLERQIEDLNDELEQLESSITANNSGIEDNADAIEGVEKRTQKLLGVYDKIVSEENPLVDGGKPTQQRKSTEPEGESGSESEQSSENEMAENSPFEFDGFNGNDDNQQLASEATAEYQEAEDDTAYLPNSEIAGTTQHEQAPQHPDGPEIVTRVSESIVDEVIAAYWLNVLVEKFGIQGTIEALTYYEQIDWISSAAHNDLLARIGGVTHCIDKETLPEAPDKINEVDHDLSYNYLMLLSMNE